MNFLQKHKPILHVCGHVHEGVGVSACLWREDGNVGIEDFRMSSYEAVLLVIRKKDIGKVSLCVNHGTLEFWNYFTFKLAEIGNYLLLEVCKRRLGGEDILTKITTKLLGSRFRYSRVFCPNVDVEETISEIKR